MVIYEVPELVTVYWEDDVKAIHPTWQTIYREDTGFRDALEICFQYVRDYGVKHWIADISQCDSGMSQADEEWAARYFNKTIVEIGIEKFVLLTPEAQTGNATIADDWEEGAKQAVGSQVQFLRASTLEEAKQALW